MLSDKTLAAIEARLFAERKMRRGELVKALGISDARWRRAVESLGTADGTLVFALAAIVRGETVEGAAAMLRGHAVAAATEPTASGDQRTKVRRRRRAEGAKSQHPDS